MQSNSLKIETNSSPKRIAIKAVNLWKIYGKGEAAYTALRGISFTVGAGQFVAIIGASGSGKSTTLDLIGTLDKPTKGEVFIDNINTNKINERGLTKLRNKKIGFVFQSYNLIPYLTAEENVEIPSFPLGISRKERMEKARKLLDELGLAGKYNHKPTELSGGEQQRVAIARAFINDPSIVIADEPTGNLDSKTSKVVIDILRKKSMEHGVTLVLATHDLELTKYCDKIIKISDGEVVSEEAK
ncbi:ABC transporter ATP-binding protein [Candidatus Parvarchaeota archaeon]|jgi:putative ABC transport system ATP-binding protein|nr:ABC transporter ATP-binding protein [Candidatus Acidifodinimicrobium mancum]